MRTRRAAAVVAAAVTVGSGSAWAAPARPYAANYALREWHTSDGLPAEDIATVRTASDGFLWLSTINAVARFDGSRFWVYPVVGDDGQPATIARTMAEWPKGAIAVAPITGGVRVWRNGQWRTIAAAAGHVYNQLFAARDGALWAATSDGVVMRFGDKETSRFTTADGFHGIAVITFADADGAVWVANARNLYRYRAGTLTKVDTDRPMAELRIASSRSGGPWVVAEGNLLKIEHDRFTEYCSLPRFAGAHFIQAMQEDADGALWLGTRSQGLFVYRAGRLSPVEVTNEDVMALAADKVGSVWAATDGGGLNRLRQSSVRLYDRSAGLLENGSSTVCQDMHGNTWLANRDGGLVRITPDGAVTLVPVPPEALVFSAVAVAPNPAGGIWVTAGPGIFRVSDTPRPIIERIAQPRLSIVRCLFAARDGALWFSADPNRLGRYQEGAFKFFGKREGIRGGGIRCIVEDPKGRLWCGTESGGLYQQAGDRFVAVDLGVATGAINAIAAKSDGTLWIGTNQSGLVVWNGARARAIGVAAGLPTNAITQILTDKEGNAWCGSPQGVFRVGKDEIEAYVAGTGAHVHPLLIGKDEGVADLVCMAFYQPGAWRGRDGRLWFATRRGALCLDPARVAVHTAPPVVRIEDVIRDDTTVTRAAGFSPPARFDKLEFRFSALCLATPELLRARYRLDGFDNAWLPAPPTHSITYPRLPPGRYRLQVTADVAGTGEQGADELDFTVPAVWWQAPWFQAVAALVGMALIGGLVQVVSHRRLRARLERMEREQAVERERTRIAQNIHDDLGAGLTHISLLTQADEQGGSHAQLEKIYRVVTGLTRSMDEIVWAVNPKYDDLDGLVYYLGNHVQEFLADAGIRCRLSMPEQIPALTLSSQVRHHLFLCCKEALNNLVKHAGATEVVFSITVSAVEVVVSIADNGRGLDAGGPAKRMVSGHGSDNMRRRMAELHGSCVIRSRDGGGTVVLLTLPLSPRKS